MEQSLQRIKNILEANPKLILSVSEKKKGVLIKSGPDIYDELNFNEDDFGTVLDLIKAEIKTRPIPEDRVEYWECYDFDGIFSFKIYEMFLLEREGIEATKKKVIDHRALKQLCDHYNVSNNLGSLFLNELKLSTSEADARPIHSAKILGLM